MISSKDWNSFRIPSNHENPSPHVFVPKFELRHFKVYVDHRAQDIAEHVEYIQEVNVEKRPCVRTLSGQGAPASGFIRTQHIDDIPNQPQGTVTGRWWRPSLLSEAVTIRISEHTQVFWEVPDVDGG